MKRIVTYVVKFKTTEDGDKETFNKKWHLVNTFGDAQRSLCGGQVFGIGESRIEFDTKEFGAVTCKQCLGIIKFYKAL